MKIVEYGKKEGKSILCIPGVFMGEECFRSLVKCLPEYHFVCVTLDGFHPHSEDFSGLEPQVEKLVHELGKRGLTQFELVLGLSMGTIFAVELARRPELSIKQLLLDGAVNFYRSINRAVERRVMEWIFSRLMNSSETNKEKYIRGLQKLYSPAWAENMYQCARAFTVPSLKAVAKLLTDYTLEPGVKQPMYLLYGGRESNIWINRRTVKRLYPQARIQIKWGYHHLCYLSLKPEKYAKLVENLVENREKTAVDLFSDRVYNETCQKTERRLRRRF